MAEPEVKQQPEYDSAGRQLPTHNCNACWAGIVSGDGKHYVGRLEQPCAQTKLKRAQLRDLQAAHSMDASPVCMPCVMLRHEECIGTCECTVCADNTYVVELAEKRLRGCAMTRAFPWEVKRSTSKHVVTYAKTKEGAEEWVRKQGGRLAQTK